MEEICVGDYIRLKEGAIHKIISCNELGFKDSRGLIIHYRFLDQHPGYKVGKTKLELIEKGDFVNGKRVDNVSGNMIALEYCDGCNFWGEVIDDESQIKTVLTKAQYKNNCFKEELYDM